eukprot:9471560-Pyramimonas_sp.AAC.1
MWREGHDTRDLHCGAWFEQWRPCPLAVTSLATCLWSTGRPLFGVHAPVWGPLAVNCLGSTGRKLFGAHWPNNCATLHDSQKAQTGGRRPGWRPEPCKWFGGAGRDNTQNLARGALGAQVGIPCE